MSLQLCPVRPYFEVKFHGIRRGSLPGRCFQRGRLPQREKESPGTPNQFIVKQACKDCRPFLQMYEMLSRYSWICTLCIWHCGMQPTKAYSTIKWLLWTLYCLLCFSDSCCQENVCKKLVRVRRGKQVKLTGKTLPASDKLMACSSEGLPDTITTSDFWLGLASSVPPLQAKAWGILFLFIG